MVTSPYGVLGPFDTEAFREMRRRMMFDYFKWDPQVGDACTTGAFAIVLSKETWRELARAAESLAGEVFSAERELMERIEWHDELGLPKPIRRILARASAGEASPAAARIIRFDFHYTSRGWRISEANTDVPGGFNEAEGLAIRISEAHPNLEPCGQPSVVLAQEVTRGMDPASGIVALVHATAYTDDSQVMLHLARALEARGYRTALASPDQVHRAAGGLQLRQDSIREPVIRALRFFPGEWLINLDRRDEWSWWFRGSPAGLCNPGTALLSQTKRFPLVWSRLQTPMSSWRRYLPETRDVRSVPQQTDSWILKPAFGRVGEGIGMPGVTPADVLKKMWRAARRCPEEWIAQERFEAGTVDVRGVPWTVCLGVYTVNEQAVGIYGRASTSPLIGSTACDVAVVVERNDISGGKETPCIQMNPCS